MSSGWEVTSLGGAGQGSFRLAVIWAGDNEGCEQSRAVVLEGRGRIREDRGHFAGLFSSQVS